MACRLAGAKPLSEPMTEYSYFDPQEQTSVKCLSEYIYFIQENTFENVVRISAAICLGLNVLINISYYCWKMDRHNMILHTKKVVTNKGYKLNFEIINATHVLYS